MEILIKKLFRFIGFVISWEGSTHYSRSLIQSNKSLTEINNTMYTVYFDFLETNASKNITERRGPKYGIPDVLYKPENQSRSGWKSMN